MRKAVAASVAFIVLVLAVSFAPTVSTASSYANYANNEKAVDLKILGLLNGSGNGFDLGRAPTRLEGAVMLLRLLGQEKAAEQSGWSHPFKDVPSWADAYIGYMYHSKLATGTGSGTFGSNEPLSAIQYTVFVLRSLGYDDRNNDFIYGEALEKAQQLGLLTAETAASLKSKKTFLRDDMVGISYNALNVKMKASGKTLLDKLIFDDRAVYGPAATVLGLYTTDLNNEIGYIDSYAPASTSFGYTAKNSGDLFMILRKFFYRNQQQFNIDIRSYGGNALKDFEQAYERAYKAVTQATGVDSYISSWKYISNGSTLSVTVNYRFTKKDFDAKAAKAKSAVNKARTVVAGLISKDMPAFDKEKLLHDYIINNASFDIKNYNSGNLPEDDFTAYGCLVNGVAVCEGYSRAMKLLSDLSGIESMVITGDTYNGEIWEGHAWNLVKLDGDWYHLDVTFDDPVMGSGENILTYNYFNLTDSEIGKISIWEKSDYPVCNSVKYGYYYRNNLIANNLEEFTDVIREAANKRESLIEVKIKNYSSEGEYKNLSKIVLASGSISQFKYIVNEDLGVVRIFNIKYL